MTRAREWQVSLDFKARLDEDAAFDLMEALGRYGASVAVDPGHTGGGLTLAVDAPDGETALAKARTLLEENMPGASVTSGLGILRSLANLQELHRLHVRISNSPSSRLPVYT